MDFLFWIGSGNFEKFLVSQELGYGQKLVKVIISGVFIYLDNKYQNVVTLIINDQ